MKKKLKLFVFFVIIFLLSNNVCASDLSYRSTKENKPYVTVGETNLYVTVSLLFDVEGARSKVRLPVNGVSCKFENDSLYVSVKRSEINKVLKENTYDSLYSLLEVNADFLDLNPNKKYYYFKQQKYDSPEYTYNPGDKDYYVNNFNFMEVYSTTLPLSGFSMEWQKSDGGGILVYESESLPQIESYSKILEDNINVDGKLIFGVDRTTVFTSIIEDEQIDLGENTTIIGSGGTMNEETNQIEHDVVEIDKFYGEYFENNKLKYSWTMYDENGNEIDVNNNTMIKLDDSKNETEILSNFDGVITDIKDRVKIISFEHEGELEGTANIRLYVGDKFKPGELLTLYYFNPESGELENIENEQVSSSEIGNIIVPNENNVNVVEQVQMYKVLVDEEGYVVIKLTHCSEYVLVNDQTQLKKDEIINTSKKELYNGSINYFNNDGFNCILLIIVLVIIIIICFAIKKYNLLNLIKKRIRKKY